MLNRLQQKWKIGSKQLILVIATFAIGGSLTGYVARKLMLLFSIEQRLLWVIVYILIVVLLWPLIVLIISIPFGQFRFFRKYIKRIAIRMRLIKKQEVPDQNKEPEIHIAIFASGTGSNTQKIIDHFRHHPFIKIAMIGCNNPKAGVLQIAAKENIPSFIIDKEIFFRGDAYVNELRKNKIDLIVLAGFLWKIPESLILAFPEKIINIHPALLPKYGGKGMYGHHVHEAVFANHEKESGISIHYVDNLYDHGKILFQAKCPVLPNDTADILAQRVHQLEHQHYPIFIEELIGKSSFH